MLGLGTHVGTDKQRDIKTETDSIPLFMWKSSLHFKDYFMFSQYQWAVRAINSKIIASPIIENTNGQLVGASTRKGREC